MIGGIQPNLNNYKNRELGHLQVNVKSTGEFQQFFRQINTGRTWTFYALLLKFIYSEKATKFCEIFPLLLTTVHTVKSKGKISQNFVAFSEYMNFNKTGQIIAILLIHPFLSDLFNWI